MSLFVELQVGEVGIFDKQNRHIGMGLADYFEEGYKQGIDLFDIHVGNAVEYDQAGIGYGGDDVGDLEIELAVAADATERRPWGERRQTRAKCR